MLEKIVTIVADQLGCDADFVTEDSAIIEDLGADSLDVVEMLMTVEENFGITIPDEEIPNLKTIRDIVTYVDNNMQ